MLTDHFTLTEVVNWLLAHVHGQALTPIVVAAIDALLILLGVVMPVVTFLIYLLRKVIGFMQRRLGPMRVGPFGVLQTIADAVKLLHKEDLTPENADRLVYKVAPYLVFVPALLVYVVIPFGQSIQAAPGVRAISMVAKDLNVGLVYLTAISSVTVVGVIAAGWSSDNKWSLLGGLRSAAQLVSYELPMTLALLGPALMSGSLSLSTIVEKQAGVWYALPQAIGFLVYFIAALAEISHIPFDLPEAESELVAGYNVEYSGMRFGLFFLGEFANSFTICAVAVTLFFGGWHLWPGWDPVDAAHAGGLIAGVATVVSLAVLVGISILTGRRIAGLTSATDFTWRGWLWSAVIAGIILGAALAGFISLVVFLMKTSVLVFILMWVRGTLPRVRIDQMMELCWKVMVPLALLNFLMIAFQVTTGVPTGWILNVGFVVLVAAMFLPRRVWSKA